MWNAIDLAHQLEVVVLVSFLYYELAARRTGSRLSDPNSFSDLQWPINDISAVSFSP